MALNRPNRIDIDGEFPKAALHEIAAGLRVELPPQKSGQLRLPCIFCDAGNSSSYGNLVINLDHPANLFIAHCCGVKGNRLTLMYVWKHGRLPPGGSVRADAYKEMVELHQQLTGTPPENSAALTQVSAGQATLRAETAEILTNVPLKQSAKETSRALADFCDDLVTDPQQMAPPAAKFARQRKAWLTPEIMQRWGVGWSPSRSMFRKNYFIYTHRDEQGNVLSYSGRDLYFEEKRRKWEQADRPADTKPIKHRFVKGYHKGQELYGQHKQRLTPDMIAALAKYGLVVAEGMNDVIRLDCLGLAAVGLCSNRASDHQIAKIVRFAKSYAAGRIWLMPDNDVEGQQGFRELLWKLQQQAGIDARPAWSSEMHGGAFHEREPEEITDAEFAEVLAPFLLRREAE